MAFCGTIKSMTAIKIIKFLKKKIENMAIKKYYRS
jgi:hypothetical protein